MFMTDPGQFQGSGTTSIEPTVAGANVKQPAKDDPEEARRNVLHELWLNRISAQARNQNVSCLAAQFNHASNDFSPPDQEPDQTK